MNFRYLFLLLLIFTSCKNEIIFQNPLNNGHETCFTGSYNQTTRINTNKQFNVEFTSTNYSEYVVILDFNGYMLTSTLWNQIYGDTINCTSSGLNLQEIKNIIDSVRKDFIGINLKLTTNENVYKRYPSNRRIRLIITENNSWKPGSGGVSFNGSIKWGNETPAFVFTRALNYNVKYIAEVCSHEIGHTVSLNHQVVCVNGTVTSPYRIGTIMGSSLNTNNAYWGIGTTGSNCEIVDDTLKMNSFLQ